MENKKLLLIIPFFNESLRMDETEFCQALGDYPNYDFLLVNDGSTDDTLIKLNNIAQKSNNVAVLELKKNGGKAEAIRQGVLNNINSNYFHIGYLDADFATPLSELHKIKLFADENPNYEIVMGSRIKKLGSNITRYNYRHYFGRVFATITSMFILKAPVYDTQCGAKIIKHDKAVELFQKPFITKWLFDIELLLRYKQKNDNYTQQIFEFSLTTWTEKGASKITLKDMLGFPSQLLKIHFHYGRNK